MHTAPSANRRRARAPLAAILLLVSVCGSALSQTRWIATWATANMPAQPDSVVQKLPFGKQDVTVRQVVRLSQGGTRLRITLTNEFGTAPLRIAGAHIAFLSAGSTILDRTDRALTFSGQASVTILPGQTAASDALTCNVPIFTDLVISTLIPAQPMPALTYHAAAWTTSYLAAGDALTAHRFAPATALASPNLSAPDITAPIRSPATETSGNRPITKAAGRPAAVSTTPESGQSATLPSGISEDVPAVQMLAQSTSWFFLKDVEVNAEKKSAAIVAFGDSITDGHGSTPETNRRWPDQLAALLSQTGPLLRGATGTEFLSVLNEGIGGNRLLHERTGPSAIDRFERDVLRQPGVRDVIMLEGINDIGQSSLRPAEAVTAQQIIGALTELARRAHSQNLRAYAATLLPYRGAGYFTSQGEAVRQQVNAFIRANSATTTLPKLFLETRNAELKQEGKAAFTEPPSSSTCASGSKGKGATCIFDGLIDFDLIVRDPDHPDALLPKYDHGDHLHPSDLGYTAMANGINPRLFHRPKK